MTDIIGSGGGGKSGGGSARTPQESPDSLRNTSFAVVMDIISNGEISGFADPASPLKNVFLDGTPVQNNDDSLNFQNVKLDFRAGTSSQSIVPAFQNSANIINDGREIKQSVDWVQAISNPSLTAVRLNVRLPQLVRTIDSGDQIGDRVGSAVELRFDIATNGGAYQQVLADTISGKTISGYTRTYRLNLPAGTSWSIRVRRITADSTSDTLLNKTFMQSYVEVTDGKFVYPMTAYSVLRIDAEQFQSIPSRGYRIKGRIIQVPVNYDPVTRIYTGVWNGTFKLAYSNNPAWIYYDILVNKLYGLGDRVNAAMVDRYAVYQIGAYCDQMVPNGQGGTEPRFVCNAYIQGQQDALRVLNDLSSVFRGMVYYAGGRIVPVADSPSDPVYTYTNANVVDGRVTYTGADVSTIKTVALVSYNDPTDFYRSKVEVVEDRDGISRYGVKKLEITAFGCTSRGQAQRVGLYHLFTSYMETGGASFSVGLDGVIPQPGKLIKLADRNRAGRRIGGRIKSATTTQITLDYDHQIVSGNSLTVTLATGAIQSRNVTGVSGRVITVSPAYSSAPEPESSWAVDSTSLVTQTLRVVSVKERDGIIYDISAIFSHPGKWAAIDSNVRLDPLPVSIVPPRAQAAPTNVVISQYHTFHQGTTRHNAEIRWDAAEGAVAYDVQWRRDNSDWIPMIRSGERLRELQDIHAGSYVVRVRSVNGLDVPSLWAYSTATTLDGMAGSPPSISSLSTVGEVMAIRLDWGYPSTPNIISFVEIRASLTTNFVDSNPLTRAAYPDTTYTVYGLGHGTEMWFWARLIDKNGIAGSWYPSDTGAGVYGESSISATEILDYLTGQITETQLAQELLELIESGGFDPTPVYNAINAEKVEREAADLALQNNIDGVDSHLSSVEAIAASKVKTYRQGTAPTGTHTTGDIWIDTANNNKIKRWSGSAWVDSDDTRIAVNAAAITSEQTARANADTALATSINNVSAVATSKNKTYRQASAPTNVPAGTLVSGDLWFDSDDSNKPYRWSGSAWVATDDARIGVNAAAISAEQTARANADGALASDITAVQAIANAKNRTYRQGTAPTNVPAGTLVAGDIWYNTSDNNKTSRWSGSAWQATDNAIIAANTAAIKNEATARANADTVEATARQTAFAMIGYSVNDNLIANPNFSSSAQLPTPSSSQGVITIFNRGDSGVPADCPAATVARFQRVSGSSDVFTASPTRVVSSPTWHLNRITVAAGDVLQLSGWMYCSGTTGTNARVGIRTYTTDTGTTTSEQVYQNYNFTTGGWQKIDLSLTASSTGKSAINHFFLVGAAAVNAAIWFCDMDLRKQSAQLQGMSAAVQTTAQAIADTNGDLAAMYTIKTQLTSGNVPYMAGIGVGVENSSGIITSQILLAANRIAVLNEANGATVAPFIIQGGQTIINSAIIGDASIGTAKIADAAIKNAKIGNGEITTAKIGDAQISNAKIGDLQVNTLKIADQAISSTQIQYSWLGYTVETGQGHYNVGPFVAGTYGFWMPAKGNIGALNSIWKTKLSINYRHNQTSAFIAYGSPMVTIRIRTQIADSNTSQILHDWTDTIKGLSNHGTGVYNWIEKERTTVLWLGLNKSYHVTYSISYDINPNLVSSPSSARFYMDMGEFTCIVTNLYK